MKWECHACLDPNPRRFITETDVYYSSNWIRSVVKTYCVRCISITSLSVVYLSPVTTCVCVCLVNQIRFSGGVAHRLFTRGSMTTPDCHVATPADLSRSRIDWTWASGEKHLQVTGLLKWRRVPAANYDSPCDAGALGNMREPTPLSSLPNYPNWWHW